MKVYRGLPPEQMRKPIALTIGNFDGVHKGHQAILSSAHEAAKAQNLTLSVMTFEPHPREFFQPEQAPPRITLLRDKLTMLALYNVQQVFIMHFNRSFAQQTPIDFVNNILVDGLNTQWIMVGDDFRYGAKRAGNYTSLKNAAEHHDFKISQTPSILDSQGNRISSSQVRQALQSGELTRAQELLGRPYFISGHVTHGNKLGRELGFPTLNIRIPYRHFTLSGIFIVQVYGLAKQPIAGIASIGTRPTVDHSQRLLLEIHLLNWQNNAYGKLIHVEFLKKVRDEQKYDSITELTQAISDDVDQAYTWFNTYGIQAQPIMQTIANRSILHC